MQSLVTSIELPSDKFISMGHLATLITNVESPRLNKAIGIDCIAAKLGPEGSPFDFAYVLSVEDRAKLQTLLPSLPPLNWRMTDEQKAQFLEAVKNLPDSPPWIPCFIDQGHIDHRNHEHNHKHQAQLNSLEQEFLLGRIRLVDAARVPQTRFAALSCTPRQDAVTYLAKCGYEVMAKADSISPTVADHLPDPSASVAIPSLELPKNIDESTQTEPVAQPEEESEPKGNTKGDRHDALHFAVVTAMDRSEQPDNPSTVFATLCQMAEDKVTPLLRLDGTEIVWRAAKRKEKKLDIEALRARMNRIRKKRLANESS